MQIRLVVVVQRTVESISVSRARHEAKRSGTRSKSSLPKLYAAARKLPNPEPRLACTRRRRQRLGRLAPISCVCATSVILVLAHSTRCCVSSSSSEPEISFSDRLRHASPRIHNEDLKHLGSPRPNYSPYMPRYQPRASAQAKMSVDWQFCIRWPSDGQPWVSCLLTERLLLHPDSSRSLRKKTCVDIMRKSVM